MAKPEHVAEGILMFTEAELLPALGGWKIWAAGTVLVLARQQVHTILDGIVKNKAVAALGIVDESGEIDIDAVGDALREAARKHGKMSLDIPLLDITFTFSEKNIDSLLAYIKEASGEE